MLRFFHRKEKDTDELARCPKCQKESPRAHINTCIVCGETKCISCGAWRYFYVMEKKPKGKILETKAFCSYLHEKQWIQPFIDKFLAEHKENARLLPKQNKSSVEDWFSREIGYAKYQVYCENLEEFFEDCKFYQEIEHILQEGKGLVKVENPEEATRFIRAITRRCSIPLHMLLMYGEDCCYLLVEKEA